MQVHGRHGRRPGGGWGLLVPPGACRPVADGRIGMDTQPQQREEGVFFTQAVASGSGGRKGQGCVPCSAVSVLFTSLFPPPAHSAAGGSQKKHWHSVKPQNPGLQSGVLPLTCSNSLPAADTGMFPVGFVYRSMYSHIVQRSESLPVSREELAPLGDTPTTSHTAAIFFL